MLKLLPKKNRAKSMFVATQVQCRHFGSVSMVKKACRPQNHCLFIRCSGGTRPRLPVSQKFASEA